VPATKKVLESITSQDSPRPSCLSTSRKQIEGVPARRAEASRTCGKALAEALAKRTALE